MPLEQETRLTLQEHDDDDALTGAPETNIPSIW